jgi:primosomal protein N' (replication factor Y) (superfamily II helicase)
MFVKVAVNVPIHKTFTYHIPEALQSCIAVGKSVLVPFGRRQVTAYIIDIIKDTTDEPIKDIIGIADSEPFFDSSDLQFYRWVADYYLYPLGKTLGEILPGEDLKSIRRFSVNLKERGAPLKDLSEQQIKIIDFIKSSPRGYTISHLKKSLPLPDLDKAIRGLRAMGLIEEIESLNGRNLARKTERMITLDPESDFPDKLTAGQLEVVNLVRHYGEVPLPRLMALSGKGRSVISLLIKKNVLVVRTRDVLRCVNPVEVLGLPEGSFQPNDDQMAALRGIMRGLDSGLFAPCLLHGVTGSGKTEVYFLAMKEVLKRNGSILFLVPEIGLTPQLLGRLHERFPGEQVAVLHSGISPAVRYDQWRCIRRGDIRVVVGARSALFSPIKNLRLIIVDEEHDESYKQDDRIRYNARDLAIVKAQMVGATVVLGSATPAIQSYYNTLSGKYACFNLPNRVEKRTLPHIEIVDMRLAENGDGGKDALPILSRRLKEALRETLGRKKQALLLLNRRGFSTIMLCRDCGHVLRCRNCDLTLTFHAREEILTCHYCDFTVKSTAVCPECGGSRIAGYGVGTERLEDMIKAAFPEARVARMDRDTTLQAGAHERILRALASEEIDILVGTQMISKGHDFPGVVLVGVISADISLNIPDFRASEKAFQLLTQVSGRGGRGDFPGRVIIQTFNPGHYVLQRVKDHDFQAFYHEEAALRESLAYPPYARMINLQISCVNKDRGWQAAQELGKVVRELSGSAVATEKVNVIGPAEAPLARIRGRYRWQLLLKGSDSRILHNLVQDIFSRHTLSGIDVKVDVDPMNFM